MEAVTPEGHGDEPVEHLLYIDHMLRVTCSVRPGPSVVRLVGEVDRSNSVELLRALETARAIDPDLVVDVARLDFTDVSGVRALVVFARRDGARVRNTPHQMSRVMRLMRVPPFDEVEE
jgi:anti-anti-sigma regulatory factor